MKKYILSVFIIILSVSAGTASHIVGGEIELVHKRSYTYQLILKMYVDVLNANPGVINSELGKKTIGIYEKNTNAKKDEVILGFSRRTQVSYGPSCDEVQSKQIGTDMMTFLGDVILTPDKYSSPNGYYAVWENCCRNETIVNIVSPDAEGMAFYMEFPAVIKNGVRFYNNSPQFKQIRGDFPCTDKIWNFDFSGTDFNGDSLVYRAATPLAGHAFAGGPALPNPGPYDSIDWKPGYSRTNQIPGTPPFNIHPVTGMISFIPNLIGLYVFSVEVDEYRYGQKIGMVKRDFQVLVIDCPPNEPPDVSLKYPDQTNYNSSTDTLLLSLEKDTCFILNIIDSNTYELNENDIIVVKMTSNNLPTGIVSFNSPLIVTPANPIANATICFDACNKLFISNDTTFNILVTITDAPKCPMSSAFFDTLDIKIRYKPQANAPPTIGVIPAALSYNAIVGKPVSFAIFGEDTDPNDVITLNGSGIGFDMSGKGMSFSNISGIDSIGSTFTWTPTCDDISEEKYKLRFIVKDNSCQKQNQDTIFIEINVADTATGIVNISPPNLFTPNGDGLNEYFEIPNMPQGNCEFFFRKITIFNRWGSKVFESSDPDFKWSGDKNPTGIYFYNIDINKKEFKGWVELIR